MISPTLSTSRALASALLLWTVSAGAGEKATLALHTSTCSAEEDAALRQALEVELRAMQVEPRWGTAGAPAAPARFTLRAECDAPNDRVALRLWSSAPALVLARTVALRDVAGPARARTLALVISEAIGPAVTSRDGAPTRRATAAREPRTSGADLRPSAAGAASASVASRASGEGDEAAGESSSSLPAVANQPDSRPARAPRGSRRSSGFIRDDPYGPDELYSTSSPYGMPHGFRIGTGALGRLALRDSSVLLGLELGTNGPLAENADWAIELSHSSSTAWTSDLDVSWWSASFGVDFVDVSALALAAGPRLSFGHLDISDLSPFGEGTERTLVTQLGVRAKLDVPVGERTGLQTTFSAHRTVGVYALTPYSGLDRDLNGWVLSWGLGLGFEP